MFYFHTFSQAYNHVSIEYCYQKYRQEEMKYYEKYKYDMTHCDVVGSWTKSRMLHPLGQNLKQPDILLINPTAKLWAKHQDLFSSHFSVMEYWINYTYVSLNIQEHQAKARSKY